MSVRFLRMLALSLLALPIFASTANATSADIRISVAGELSVVDADGGSHDLRVVKSVGESKWTITDLALGANLAPDPADPRAIIQCTMLTPHSYECVSGGVVITSLLIDSGHGNDVIDVRDAGLPSTVLGFLGNDTITGSDLADTLDGGDGTDTVDGRLGDDIIMGGIGSDALYGGGDDDSMQAVDGVVDSGVTCDGSPSGGTSGPTANGDDAHIDLDPLETAAPAPDCDSVERHAPSGGGTTPPVNQTAPGTPQGAARIGTTLTSTHGTWAGTTPMSFSVNWQRCDTANCTNIAGATSLSYQATTGDTGSMLRLAVTASNAAGSSTAFSTKTGAVTGTPPTLVANPAGPTGSATVGSKLTSSYGTWSGSLVGTAGQWERCKAATCSAISGATALTYTAATADLGFQLRFHVVASYSGGVVDAWSGKSAVVTKPAPPAPNDPPRASGSNCNGGEKATKVGSLFICYRSATEVRNNATWNLTGPVTINRVFFFADSTTVQIDTAKKTIIAEGPNTKFGLVNTAGSWARVFTATNVLISNPGDTFTAEMWNAKLPDPYTSGGLRHTILDSSGYYAEGAAHLRVTGYQSSRKFGWTSGVRLMGNAMSVTGPVTYDWTGAITTRFHGCADGILPVQASNIIELRNPCISYDANARQWKLEATATVLNDLFTADANAGLVNGALDDVAVQVNSANKLPIPFGAYLDGGGVNVGGLQTNNLNVGGNLSGGWPYSPSSFSAEVVITGDIQYNVPKRTLTIAGTGHLYAGGNQLADGWANLNLVFGTNALPKSIKVKTHVDAFSGFIEGDATVSITGSGFFADTKARVGFPHGADITNLANYTIRDYTKCHWATVTNPFTGVSYSPCPNVSGWSTDMNVVVSNNGAGVKGGIGSDPKWRVSATCWWSVNNGWGVNVAWGESKDLDFLKRVQGKYGEDIVADVSSDTFEVQPGTQFIALQLHGSTTGHVIVRDPKGKVVADTAAGSFATEVGFGRDPGGGAAAVLMIPGTSVVPGKWTITRSGDSPFTSVRPVTAAADAPEAKITRAAHVGGPATRLTAGRSRVLITWAGPAGAKVGLRATTPDGTTSMPIVGGKAAKGSYVWTVPVEWAGPMRVQAVTQRDGVPVSTETFATTFTVTRPLVAAPRPPRVARLGKGVMSAAWNRVAGARKYELEVRVAGVRKPIRFISTKPTLRLDLDARGRVLVRVRGISALGIGGTWSRFSNAAPAKKPKPVRRPVRRPTRR